MSTDSKEQRAESIRKTISDKKKAWVENRATCVVISIVSYPFVVLILTGVIVAILNQRLIHHLTANPRSE